MLNTLDGNMGNRSPILPWGDGYLPDDAPCHWRVYKVEDHDPDGDGVGYPWQVDGCGVYRGEFYVTDEINNFRTWDEALRFVKEQSQ